uniref:Uncharacterized protein n=1 Tax=Tetradesmus obliquus TaxID=3088 RepID=A0A383VTR6_TETOB|eukprot:jgi/Sobl393_1/16404/SZX67786.1
MGRQSPVLASHHHSYHPRSARSAAAAATSSSSSFTVRLTELLLVLAAGWAVVYLTFMFAPRRGPAAAPYLSDPVLISYAYFEKDAIQLANFEYFLAVGSHYPLLHSNMHWVFVVSGEKCSPCPGLYSGMSEREGADLTAIGIKEASYNAKFTLLVRSENVGMDLGAHNATLEWLSYRGTLSRYKYFIFLNSSVKGPFLPAWTPPEWHWTAAYLAAFQPPPTTIQSGHASAALLPGFRSAGSGGPPVHAVSSSLVCLPPDDAAGPGPRLESWAFALDQEGLAAAVDFDVFLLRGCKLCKDEGRGVVVGGEYGITKAMFESGYNIATLMSRYARGIDWTDQRHWSCNDNVHPSRAGLYDGISMHPYETVFVKSSWHVAEPYTKRYSQWQLQHLLGKSGTEGQYNRRLYLYGVSKKAEAPRDLEAAYKPILD